eukprot:gb/GFBE01023826.1/.p1 GENE.gb/GFBE01023826.1/~~gb/GFBE01023826.1/.p1  ORF type:complete len:195 (+),score=43.30 gb/GFBE01023826.1/:1-585(+)
MADAHGTASDTPKADVEPAAKKQKKRHSAVPRTLVFIFDQQPPRRVLLLRYSEKKGKMAGMHNAPGGHVERGEDVLASARREVREETGLELEASDLRLSGIVHVQDFFGVDVMMFVASAQVAADRVELVASDEGDLHWVPIDEVATLVSEGKAFEDIPKLLQATVESIGGTTAFTGRSRYDGGGKLLELVVNGS